MKLIFFTKYTKNGASSRLRSYQYKKLLETNGYNCYFLPLHPNKYLDKLYNNRLKFPYALVSYVKRFIFLFSIKKTDLLIIEKELFPYFPPIFEYFLSVFNYRYIVDYDDAVFHNYDNSQYFLIRMFLKNKIPKVMKYASHVIVGSEYIKKFALNRGITNVTKIPTVIDKDKYFFEPKHSEGLIIGWIGTPYTSMFLNKIMPILETLFKKYQAKTVLVGAHKHDFLSEFVECLNWDELTEVSKIQKFDIGIMPLNDGKFEKGKCGYKLIQYMACGIPVVASGVGENHIIVDSGVNGFIANSNQEWFNFLEKLIKNKNLRYDFGQNGIKKVNNFYTLDSQINKIVRIINQVNLNA
jgi:glycosyltransferase involved in cell wall biosynthesis